jgi:hypothetical protein
MQSAVCSMVSTEMERIEALNPDEPEGFKQVF